MGNSIAKTNDDFCSLFLVRFLGNFLFSETKKLAEKNIPRFIRHKDNGGFLPPILLCFGVARAASFPLKTTGIVFY
jgi:hypothetical protein